MAEGARIAAALIREHHAIDGGIEAFVADESDPAPLRAALTALRRHIYLEERFLFPPLKEQMMMPIFVMLREHGELWRRMDAIEQSLDAAGADTPSDADARALCGDLLALLEEHNSKEEPVIYPHADADLTEEQRAELGEFIAVGAYPAGWVCEKA